MGTRDKAIEELKKQMALQKERIDPKLLQAARKAANLKQEGRAKKDMVPYDREAAADAVALFLHNHADKDFEQRLRALLKQTEQ